MKHITTNIAVLLSTAAITSAPVPSIGAESDGPEGITNVTQMPGQIPESHPSRQGDKPAWTPVARKSMVFSKAEDVDPLKVGDAAPLSVKIKGADGETITLKDALKGGKTVVVFYRGGWCPYCNTHLAELVRVQPQLTNSGVQLLALSPDSPETLAKHAEERPLPYRLLSDNAHEAMKAFGIAFRMDDVTLERYKGYGIDLSAASGNEDKVLPVPAVFVIEDGTITYAHANADYTVRMKGEELLKAAGVDIPSPE